MKSLTGTRVGIRGETDFLRRQNNRIVQKQKKLKSIKLKGIHLLLILALLSLIAFAIYKTGQFVLTWEKLNVKSFRLTRCSKTTLKEAKKILSRYSGNILTLSLQDLRTQLVSVPEVKEVSISRILPSTIEINFFLRKPVFQVEMKVNGKYNIIDKEGVIQYYTVNNLLCGRSITEILRILESIQYLKEHPGHACPVEWKSGDKTIYSHPLKSNFYFKELYSTRKN